jgi:hypothetical protein
MKVVLGATLAIPFLVVSLLAAGEPKPAPSAPVPAQVLAAKTVFIVNDGESGIGNGTLATARGFSNNAHTVLEAGLAARFASAASRAAV